MEEQVVNNEELSKKKTIDKEIFIIMSQKLILNELKRFKRAHMNIKGIEEELILALTNSLENNGMIVSRLEDYLVVKKEVNE